MRALALATLATLVATCGVSVGCVTLGTHEELQRAHAATKERLADEQLDGAACEKKLDDTEAREVSLKEALSKAQMTSAQLDADIVRARKDHDAAVAALKADLEKQQGELAQVIKDKSALKGSVDEMKTALEELARRKAEADKRIAEYRGLLD